MANTIARGIFKARRTSSTTHLKNKSEWSHCRDCFENACGRCVCHCVHSCFSIPRVISKTGANTQTTNY